jgi:hypothetical protein
MSKRGKNRIRLTVSERTGRYFKPTGGNWSYAIERMFEGESVYCEVGGEFDFDTEADARREGKKAMKYYREDMI